MCGSIDIVEAKEANWSRCREAIIIVKLVGVNFQYIEEEFIDPLLTAGTKLWLHV